MLCNMDKNTLLRSFSLEVKKDEERPDCSVLSMFSGFQGDFGPVSVLISSELDSDHPNFTASFLQTSAQSPGDLLEFMRQEISYFCNSILPLFNPLTPFPYASISLSPSPDSQDS